MRIKATVPTRAALLAALATLTAPMGAVTALSMSPGAGSGVYGVAKSTLMVPAWTTSMGQGVGFVEIGKPAVVPTRGMVASMLWPGMMDFWRALSRRGGTTEVSHSSGWGTFAHAGNTVMIGAPAPVVPVAGTEWEQWRRDMVSRKYRKLDDRQLLFMYYLAGSVPPGWFATERHAVLEAVAMNVKKRPAVTALGVEYELAGVKIGGEPELYRRVAIPIKWEAIAYDFVSEAHKPSVVAKMVKAFAGKAQTRVNFAAVTKWSALAMEGAEKLRMEIRDADVKTLKEAHPKALLIGPSAWQTLKPLASFIAVDRDLDIEGVEPLRILTSKKAWAAAK